MSNRSSKFCYLFLWVKVGLLFLVCSLIPSKKLIIILDRVAEMERQQIWDLVSAVSQQVIKPNCLMLCPPHLKEHPSVPLYSTPLCISALQKLSETFAGIQARNENVALIGMVMNAETALCSLLPDGYVMSNSSGWGTLCFEWSRQKQKVVVCLSTTPWKSFLIKAPPCPFIIPLYIIRMLQLSVPIRPVFFHANQFDSITIC